VIQVAATGYIHASEIEAAIGASYLQIFRVVMSLPSGDVPLGNGQAAALGTVSISVQVVSGP
jgi:hypothetical protein